eukprot:4026285-Pleurochrysis_carterae.AAC.3
MCSANLASLACSLEKHFLIANSASFLHGAHYDGLMPPENEKDGRYVSSAIDALSNLSLQWQLSCVLIKSGGVRRAHSL